MNLRSFGVLLACVTIALAIGSAAVAQNIDAKEYWLDNGMQVLMVERHHAPTIMVAILARVGSANETTGITGISHLFEHMMFKGSETIGTKDIVRDREIMARLDSLRALMRGEERVMREGVRRGTIVDMLDPAAKTPRYREMEAVFDSLILEQRSLIIKDELSEIYGKHGGSFLNAFTTEDFTAYFVRVPKNKIELCMWLESDRFAHPVFREFYSERDVVREERRLGIESTPTGLIEEEFRAMVWTTSSYHWDVIGWASDLGSITREQADAYYDTYYAPNNLTMLLVGDLDPDATIQLVRTYFDRIPRGKVEPPDVVTLEERQHGEKRMIAEAEASPRAEVWCRTVAWKHPDSYALELLAGIMNGKTGRLYKKLVEEMGIAKSSGAGGMRMPGGEGLAVRAEQDSKKYAGAFSISAEGVAGVRAEQLEQAIHEVVGELKSTPVSDQELQKVKNQLHMQKLRLMDVMSGMGILFRLGRDAAYGDWAETNNNPAMCDRVTADDIRRVANSYFASDQRNMLLVNSSAPPDSGGEVPADPRFARALQMIQSVTDAAQLEQMISMFSMRLDQTEDQRERAGMERLLAIANDRLQELKAKEEH